MAVQNQDLRYRLLGQDVSAGSTFRKVGQEAQSAHTAIRTLGSSLNNAGAFTPLQQGLSAVGQAFSHIEENGRRASVVMQGVGIGIAGVGAALLAVGGQEQQAAAGLKSSIEATGAIFADYKSKVEEAVSSQETFGHSAGDTQNALSRLTQATNDPAAAFNLMGLAANVAAARNISLNDAATTLAQGLAGNTRAFRQFGITLDGVGSKAEQIGRAFDQLESKLAGQAAAKADTFSGHVKAMGVQIEDTVSALTRFSPALLTIGSVLTVVGAATDALNRKRAQEVLAADAATGAETRLARATSASGDAALVAGNRTGVRGLFNRAALGKAGGLALGGLLLGQVAGAGIGGRSGSTVGDALTGAGIGAGIGSIVPLLGTGIGAGVGGVLGGAFGFLHSGSAAATEQQADLSKVLYNLDAANRAQANAALTSKFQSFLPGEFDQTGNPKAKAVATATESLAKAKTRLARAQEDLNKQQATQQDPSKVAAAEARLNAAEANLRKAQYLGGDARIASAQAAVASAHASLLTSQAGKDTTTTERRVHDAQQAVNDAQHRVRDARRAARGLGIGDVLNRQRGNVHTEHQDVVAQATLVRAGLTQRVIEEIDALNKSQPGTLENVAGSITPHTAALLNKQAAAFAREQAKFADIGKRAAVQAQRKRGEELANALVQGYQAKLTRLGLDADLHNVNPVPVPASYGGTGMDPNRTTAGVTESQYGIHINNVTVQANDPQKFVREISGKARHRALSSSSAQVPGSRLLGP